MRVQLQSPPGAEASHSFLVKLMAVPVPSQTMSAGVLPLASFLVTVMLVLGRSPWGVGVEPTMIPPAKAEAAAGRFAVTVLWRIVMWSAPRIATPAPEIAGSA